MSKYLFNMSCPPRSEVNFSIMPLSSSYILINPYEFCEYLKCSFKDLKYNLEQYYKKNKKELEVNIPKSFIIIKSFEIKDINNIDNQINELKKTFNIEFNYQITTKLVLISRFIGDLYIPNREPEFNLDKLNSLYLVGINEIDI